MMVLALLFSWVVMLVTVVAVEVEVVLPGAMSWSGVEVMLPVVVLPWV